MEPKVSDEEILNAFIENDGKLDEKYTLESLDKKQLSVVFQYKLKEISKIADLLFNDQNVDKTEKKLPMDTE